MKSIFFKTLIASVILISGQNLLAQKTQDSAWREHDPMIEGNGSSGTYGSNHNPDSKDRSNNGTAVVNDLKGSKNSKDSTAARRNDARNIKGTKGTVGATSPQNSSSPK